MDILIEGSKLDFKLEKEKNILEIIEYLETWLSKRSKIIEEIKVDGNYFFVSDIDFLKEKLITETKKIEIKTIDNNDYAASSLLEVESYINRFLLQIDNNDFLTPDRKDEIIEGLKWINEIIISSSRILSVMTELLFYYEKSLAEIISKNNIIIVELENHKYNPNIFKEIIEIKLKNNLQNLLYYLPRIINRSVLNFASRDNVGNIDSIAAGLRDMVNTIESFMPVIPNIGYILHSGNEAQGYLEIKNILFVMESMVYCLNRIENIFDDVKYTSLTLDNKSVDLINKDFNDLLKELSEALLKKDIVLLCDLLEYEVIEKLQIYRRIFEDLVVLIEKKSYPY